MKIAFVSAIAGLLAATPALADPCTNQAAPPCVSGYVTWMKPANKDAPACLVFELDNNPGKKYAIPDDAIDAPRIWDMVREAYFAGQPIGLYADGSLVTCDGTTPNTPYAWSPWVGTKY